MKNVFENLDDRDEALLPDGWDGETDIFADDGALNDEAFLRDGGGEVEEKSTTENTEGKSDEDFLTTEVNRDDVQNTDAGTEAEPDGAKQGKAPRVLKLKVNHEEQEIDIDAMSDEDLISLLQKGRAFDSAKDAEKQALYRRVYQEQIDAGMTEDAAEMVAERRAGKHYSLTDEPEPEPEESPITKTPRNFKEEVEQLRALYPDFKEMPDDVAHAVANGTPLLSAYLAYRDKENSKAAATLRKENTILKQNAASAAKAIVRGVSGGGDSTPKRRDYFSEGFDSDTW